MILPPPPAASPSTASSRHPRVAPPRARSSDRLPGSLRPPRARSGRPECRPHLWAAAGCWPLPGRRSEPRAEQLPLQLAPPAQSYWEELAGASVAYVRPLFLDKHSSVSAAISPAFLTPSSSLVSSSKPALCPGLSCWAWAPWALKRAAANREAPTRGQWPPSFCAALAPPS